jgi:uncharacterized protein YraI
VEFQKSPERLARLRTPHIVLSLIAASALVIALAGVAVGGDKGGYSADGVNIRTGPTTGYTSVGLGYSSQYACHYFSVEGETINGYRLWSYHQNLSTSVTGYSTWAYMYVIVFPDFIPC